MTATTTRSCAVTYGIRISNLAFASTPQQPKRATLLQGWAEGAGPTRESRCTVLPMGAEIGTISKITQPQYSIRYKSHGIS